MYGSASGALHRLPVRETPILNLHEALSNWEQDPEHARDYVESVVDHMWDATLARVARLPHFCERMALQASVPVHS